MNPGHRPMIPRGLIWLCDGDIELDVSARVFNPKIYRGHEGIRRFHREVSEVWEEFRWEPQRFSEVADRVVVLLHSHGRGRGSGIEMARDATSPRLSDTVFLSAA